MSGDAIIWLFIWLFMVFGFACLMAGVRDAIEGNTVGLYCAAGISAVTWCFLVWGFKLVLS